MWTQNPKSAIMDEIKAKFEVPEPPIPVIDELATVEPEEVKEPEPLPTKLSIYPVKVYNKIEDNWHLSNKKALFLNMRHYYESMGEDPFHVLPLTFHIKSVDD